MRVRSRGTLLGFLFMLLLTPSEGATQVMDQSLKSRIRALLEQLASAECVVRQRAVLEEARRRSAPDIPIRKLIAIWEEELKTAKERARPKGQLIIESLRSEQEVDADRGTQAWFEKWLQTTIGAPDARRAKEFQRAKVELLRIAKDRTANMRLRTTALAFMAYIVDHYGDPHGRAERMGVPIKDWKRELGQLLDSRDPDVAIIAAEAMAGLEAFSQVDQSKLIAKLIQGLRHRDFDIRVAAQVEVRNLTGQDFCIDPTDPPSERESGIRKWEEWRGTAKTDRSSGK